MGKSKVILPKKLISDPAKMERAITNALTMQAKAIRVDFQVTTQTWEHAVTFAIDVPNAWTRIIGTDDAIYAMLNEGTPPHMIEPRRATSLAFRGPFQSKTVPNQIMSRSGRKGTNQTILPRGRGVRHPGTKARTWDAAIAKKWRPLFPVQMQRAIDAAAS